MKTFVIALLAIVCFSTQVYAQETPRTLQQIQTEFSQWQTAFSAADKDYRAGMQIVERSMSTMEQAKAKLQALVEEAKTLQVKKVPATPTTTEEAPVK